ncbi:D-aminoacyl-tRNA deacylase [Lewinella sp. IMCC34191]|uniref:D-aminoacyl-tRNA deacylase n=1 Tax=Lewinella sp. IMCC34191 TaxID=2259172 RepID=UPI000E23CECC|nr:D-aminoacyl-tRNA deacylase [Lewinella sp. IMCC34191]
MRILIQRVSEARVTVEGTVTGEIGPGLLIFVGIEEGDDKEDIEWLAGKVSRLRIFNDEDDKMNHSVTDVDGGILCVSQFTLFASTQKGNRPGFTRSAAPRVADPIYERFVAYLGAVSGRTVETGTFGADMKVSLVNDGPVTIWMDSKARE